MQELRRQRAASGPSPPPPGLTPPSLRAGLRGAAAAGQPGLPGPRTPTKTARHVHPVLAHCLIVFPFPLRRLPWRDVL